jgi:hypothetical protein
MIALPAKGIMRRFVTRLVIFATIGAVLIYGTWSIGRSVLPLGIPSGTRVLVVGDSRTECAIDDTVLSGVYNWSQSGTAYFYSYIKVRSAIEHDLQLGAVILGYSYGELSASRDAWFSDSRYLSRLKKYFPLLNGRDFGELFRANPRGAVSHWLRGVPYTMTRVITFLVERDSGDSALGGFLRLEQDNLAQALDRYVEGAAGNTAEGYSRYQEAYLARIYDLCESAGIQLVLLNVPSHPIQREAQAGYAHRYKALAEERMPNALFINHVNVEIPDSGFADLEHLNYKGAAIYSAYLREMGIEQGFKPISR